MAFQFRLEHEDGTPADPATLKAAVPDWRPGDTIPLGRGETLRVIEIRPERSENVRGVEAQLEKARARVRELQARLEELD